jgi:trehalose-phosphatase
LCLDFDGTLTPITENPEDARLSPPARKLLTALSARDDVLMALISGRALSDIRERASIAGLVYAGNHGLEISGRGLEFVEPFAAKKSRLLAPLCARLAESLQTISGASVEYKGLTASVHYRCAAPEEAGEIERIVRAALKPMVSLFRIKVGRMVWEIVPRTSWHKGAAVCWIRSRLAERETVSVIVGDDASDESAFQQGPEDITVHVGEARDTSAKYDVADTAGVQALLTRLLAVREQVHVTGKSRV